MQQLVDMLVVGVVMMLIAAGLIAATVALWIRAQRRRARAHLERTLDRLAQQVTLRVAAGSSPGWALYRYARLTDDARGARTWVALQRLIWRERLLEDARTRLGQAPERIDALTASLRSRRRHRTAR